MHQINDAIVQGGRLTLSNLPFSDGQHVRVLVDEAHTPPLTKMTIQEVRKLLKGGVVRFEMPTEPMIPPEDWEMPG
jgi:hypothetical protein